MGLVGRVWWLLRQFAAADEIARPTRDAARSGCVYRGAQALNHATRGDFSSETVVNSRLLPDVLQTARCRDCKRLIDGVQCVTRPLSVTGAARHGSGLITGRATCRQ